MNKNLFNIFFFFSALLVAFYMGFVVAQYQTQQSIISGEINYCAPQYLTQFENFSCRVVDPNQQGAGFMPFRKDQPQFNFSKN